MSLDVSRSLVGPPAAGKLGDISELVAMVLMAVRDAPLCTFALGTDTSNSIATLASTSRVNKRWCRLSCEALYGVVALGTSHQARELVTAPRARWLVSSQTHSIAYGDPNGEAMPGVEFDLIVGWARVSLQVVKVTTSGGGLTVLTLVRDPMLGTFNPGLFWCR